MLIVKTKLKEVRGKGIGLIADQEIKKVNQHGHSIRLLT
jgi:hypothetical protein